MIKATDLSVRLGGRTILEGVGLEVHDGEAVALVGANGSGKTTVLRCLLGLVPFEGYASMAGLCVRKHPIAARDLCGYVPQRAAFGDVTAIEALTFVARLRRVPEARVTEALERVSLAAHARQRTRTFSGGMLQRLSLAAALLPDPPVLLFDEPTASLDADGQRDFLEVCAGLLDRGRTVLVASHRSEEIARLTQRTVHLVGGRVLEPAPEAPPVRPAKVIRLAARAAR